MSEPGEQLGEHPAEIVVVIVENQDPALRSTSPAEWMITCHQVVRRHDAGVISDRYRVGMPPSDAVAAPARASGHQDVGEPVAEGVIRRDLLPSADVHVAVAPVQLPDPVVSDTAPGGQAGQAASRGTRPPSSRVASASITW